MPVPRSVLPLSSAAFLVIAVSGLTGSRQDERLPAPPEFAINHNLSGRASGRLWGRTEAVEARPPLREPVWVASQAEGASSGWQQPIRGETTSDVPLLRETPLALAAPVMNSLDRWARP
ncbi:hypothetical protein DPEC_G00313880 [Dallia pectoralis]|uniref:Uncharacterized protein n=1 Tax=Dallia pectoralis TaxID=75939 RepID=A0ACC2FC94_DALPE|nr:hypothetical protein DPEC_G00313880 [Dallia pectoralis]